MTYTRTIKDTPERGTITVASARKAARKAGRSSNGKKATVSKAARRSHSTKARSAKAR